MDSDSGEDVFVVFGQLDGAAAGFKVDSRDEDPLDSLLSSPFQDFGQVRVEGRQAEVAVRVSERRQIVHDPRASIARPSCRMG